ncbi:SRPBCC domain-containing protein [Frigidibacter oleivorans]|uniref:SRPBCC domain-containing protein n=1 Tax=Frigidibacter oleivorans TaxID=2487129 RepID=UPI00197AAE47|nr:SRPBCC domain-containing protein [Frigidibacter oleivorans]
MTDVPNDRELVLSRLLDAPRNAVYRCWTEAELLKQWFAPKPWNVSEAEVELRAGGKHNITMQSPEGDAMPAQGICLEAVPGEKLVVTDAFRAGWEPGEGGALYGCDCHLRR